MKAGFEPVTLEHLAIVPPACAPTAQPIPALGSAQGNQMKKHQGLKARSKPPAQRRDGTGFQPSFHDGCHPGALPQAGMDAGLWPSRRDIRDMLLPK